MNTSPQSGVPAKSRHHKSVSGRFSAAARTYMEISQLQEKVARRVMDMVPPDFMPTLVLDAGCGPGNLIAFAADRWPSVFITGVDIAPGMVREAHRRFQNDSRITLREADMAVFTSDQPFDLVLSSSALHWLRPFQEGLLHTAHLCRPGGVLAISIMLDGTLNELRSSRDATSPGKVAPARLPSFDEFAQAARSVPGSRVRRIEQSTSEFDQASAGEVLRTVHDMGVTGGDISRGNKPLTRKEIQSLTAHYDRHFATPGGVRVTFVVGYLLLEMI